MGQFENRQPLRITAPRRPDLRRSQSFHSRPTEPTPRGTRAGRPRLHSGLPEVPPPGGRKYARAGKMAAVAESPRALGRLCPTLLFLSQFYVLAGGGELRLGSRRAWLGDRGPAACGKRPGWA